VQQILAQQLSSFAAIVNPETGGALFLFQLERPGEQFPCGRAGSLAAQVGLDDDKFRSTELEHDLSARATRRARSLRICNHGEMSKVAWAATASNGGIQRGAFGAVTQSVRGVLHVATRDDPAVVGAQGGTDEKAGVGCIRTLARVGGRLHERVDVDHLVP
jgi:hypothetical protein